MANVPNRYTAENAHLYILKWTESNTYTETVIATLAAAANVFGPVRNIRITDPVAAVTQTAGGDVGDQVRNTRWGTWSISADSFLDTNAVDGDSRMAELIGFYVEFAVTNDTGFYICRGLGRFNAELIMPAEAGETVARDITIERYLGSALGNLKWANLATGVFS